MDDVRTRHELHPGLVEKSEDGGWRLIGSRCTKCGDVRFPNALGCPVCHAAREDLEAWLLPRAGYVFTFSRVYRASPPFKGPYLLAWVKLDDGPRIFSQLVADPESDVFGKRCELTYGPLWETAKAVGEGYKFRVLES